MDLNKPTEMRNVEQEQIKLEIEKTKLEQMKLEFEMEKVKQKAESTALDDATEKSGKSSFPEEAIPLVYFSIICPPLGLFFLWRHPRVSREAKIFMTIVTPLVFLLLRYIGVRIPF